MWCGLFIRLLKNCCLAFKAGSRLLFYYYSLTGESVSLPETWEVRWTELFLELESILVSSSVDTRRLFKSRLEFKRLEDRLDLTVDLLVLIMGLERRVCLVVCS